MSNDTYKDFIEVDVKAIRRYDSDIQNKYSLIARRLYELKESDNLNKTNYKGYKNIYDLAFNEFGYEERKVRYLIAIYLKFFKENMRNYYCNFTISQLRYMCEMDDEQIKKCKPDMSVNEIKKIKLFSGTRVPGISIDNSINIDKNTDKDNVIKGVFPEKNEELPQEEKVTTIIVTELPQEQRKENKTITIDVKTESEQNNNFETNDEIEYYKKELIKVLDLNNIAETKIITLENRIKSLETKISDYEMIIKFINHELDSIYNIFCSNNIDLEKIDYLIKSINDFNTKNKLPLKLHFMKNVI